MKRILTCLAVVLLAGTVSAQAGTFGVFGSYWDSDEADTAAGVGAVVGFNFASRITLEFRGTYFEDFTADEFATTFDVSVIPIDAGIHFDILPDKTVNPYVGGGVTYYLLDTDLGEIDDEAGYYVEAGLDFGGENIRFFVEALYRQAEGTVESGGTDADIDFTGITGNAGVIWRWQRRKTGRHPGPLRPAGRPSGRARGSG